MLEKEEFYPKLLVFVQFTLMGLIALLSNGFFVSLLSILIFTLGVGLGTWALLYNKIGNFNIQPKMKVNSILVTTGIYAFVRHPMYLSVIVMSFSFLFSSGTLFQILLFITLVGVLFLKAKREESLWMEKSDEYEAYRARTKLFLPFIL